MKQNEAARLGNLLIKVNPGLAGELLKCFPEKLTDLNDIKRQYKIYKKHGHNNFRVFIACMLHIHQPSIYLKYSKTYVRAGLVKELAGCFNFTKQYISEVLRAVVMEEKIYEEFKALVITNIKLYE